MTVRIDRFLHSGFDFNETESLLKFKFRMLNLILLIITFFSSLFGFMSDIDLNDVGPIHSKVNYGYSAFSLFLIYFLRRSKQNYITTVNALFIASLLTFTSALALVPQDEFRMIWFYLLIYIAYILSGKTAGIVFTVASIAVIITAYFFTDLQLSSVAITSGVLGLVIGSSLSCVYTNKATDYENSLQQKNAELHILASTDGLTGIMNKRIFTEVSEHYFETAQRQQDDLSLLMLDLDLFKKINDHYGHAVGDLILIRFVETIQTLLRRSDIFARIGGEEFAILLFKTSSKDALILAEKVRKKVEHIYFIHDGQNISVTTSIGISQNRSSDTVFDEIFLRADKALYQAKENGRNQISTID